MIIDGNLTRYRIKATSYRQYDIYIIPRNERDMADLLPWSKQIIIGRTTRMIETGHKVLEWDNITIGSSGASYSFSADPTSRSITDVSTARTILWLESLER